MLALNKMNPSAIALGMIVLPFAIPVVAVKIGVRLVEMGVDKVKMHTSKDFTKTELAKHHIKYFELPAKYQEDPEVLLWIIEKCYGSDIPYLVWGNPMVRGLIEKNQLNCIWKAPPYLQNDLGFVLPQVNMNLDCVWHVSDEIKERKGFQQIVEHLKGGVMAVKNLEDINFEFY